MVRIQDSQSWHRGSIPLSTTSLTGISAARLLFLRNELMVDSSNG